MEGKKERGKRDKKCNEVAISGKQRHDKKGRGRESWKQKRNFCPLSL